MKPINKEKLHRIEDLVISLIFVALGIATILFAYYIKGILPFFILGFFSLRAVYSLFILLRTRRNYVISIIEIIINVATIVLAIFVKDTYGKSLIIGVYCILAILMNIVTTVSRRSIDKKDKSNLFGIENIIYFVLFLSLVLNQSEDTITLGIVIGDFALYKGCLMLINHEWIMPILYRGEFAKAIRKVHGIDIVLGLLTLSLLASAMFPYLEETIPTFVDSLWYCFMLITTIGTGDFTAKTTLGRLLSGIIGIYGIVIVALLTSAIVCYYSSKSDDENKNKDEQKDEEKTSD